MASEDRGAGVRSAMSHEFQSLSRATIGGGGACYLAPVLCDARLVAATALKLPCIVQRCVFRVNPPDKNSTDPCQTHDCSWSVFNERHSRGPANLTGSR